MILMLITGLFFLTAGYIIRYIVGRRKFERRNIAGIEGFKSYNRALLISWLERLLFIVSALIITIGILMIGAWFFNQMKF